MNNLDNILITDKYPKFLRLLFFVEMWERFSYYGMRALLILFLTSELGFKDEKAYAIYSLFAALSYMGPIFGGILADKIFGFRKPVIIGGIIISLGHALMAFNTIYQDLTFLGLAFIAVGTGLFKGNITNLLGECYNKNDPARDRGFTLFYVGVNLGGFIAAVSCGYIANSFGWHYGFGLAGVGMLIGLFVFLKFEHILNNVGLAPNEQSVKKRILPGLSLINLVFIANIMLAVLIAMMFQYTELFVNILQYFGISILAVFIFIVIRSPKHDRNNLIILSIFIFFLMAFFGIEMQLGSLINLFTERNVENIILGIKVPASVSQGINPLSIIIFGYIFSNLIKIGKTYENLKFAFGLFTMAIAFGILYIGCSNAVNGKVSYLYLLISMSFIGLGEVLISPFVMEKVTTLAPQKLKGFVMGILLLALAFSNLIGILLAKFVSIPSVNGGVDILKSLPVYQEGFWNIALANLVLTGAFLIITIFIQKKVPTKNLNF